MRNLGSVREWGLSEGLGTGSEPLGASEREIWPGVMEGENFSQVFIFPRSFLSPLGPYGLETVSRKAFGTLGLL